MANIPYMGPLGDSKALALTTIFYAFKTAFLTPGDLAPRLQPYPLQATTRSTMASIKAPNASFCRRSSHGQPTHNCTTCVRSNFPGTSWVPVQAKQNPLRIHGTGIVTDPWMVDFYGKCRRMYHTWILWVTTTFDSYLRTAGFSFSGFLKQSHKPFEGSKRYLTEVRSKMIQNDRHQSLIICTLTIAVSWMP